MIRMTLAAAAAALLLAGPALAQNSMSGGSMSGPAPQSTTKPDGCASNAKSGNTMSGGNSMSGGNTMSGGSSMAGANKAGAKTTGTGCTAKTAKPMDGGTMGH